jgi:Thioredoxin
VEPVLSLTNTYHQYSERIRTHGNASIVVRIVTRRCRACKAFDLKYRKLSLELQQQQAPVVFYEMDVFAVKDVKKLLEIKVAPSIVM